MVTDVSGQLSGPIIKGQAVQKIAWIWGYM